MGILKKKKFLKLTIGAILSQVIGIALAFIIVTLWFPHTHWFTNLTVTLTISGSKILWNILIAPLYAEYFK